MRANYRPGELAELYGGLTDAGGAADNTELYRDWYASLAGEERSQIRCVASHTANHLMPVLARPFRAFCLLRDPVERVWSLYHALKLFGEAKIPLRPAMRPGREMLRRGWTLTDIYRELGGGAPSASPVHRLFQMFFNDQARNILAPWQPESELAYWTGTPGPGVALLETATAILRRHYEVGVQERHESSVARFAETFGWSRRDAGRVDRSAPRDRPDARTCAQIRAYNRLDAELHASFSHPGAIS